MNAVQFSPVIFLALEENLNNVESPTQNFLERIFLETPVVFQNWHQRAITQIDTWENSLTYLKPGGIIGWTQYSLDDLGHYIENLFAPFQTFNEWLDSQGHGDWYVQFATFLATLPVKAVRNIIRLVYNIIKEALCAPVHPVKALHKIAKLLVTLAFELTKPETWSKIGAGLISTSLGQTLVTGNPLSVIGLIIGAAMILGGLTVGTLQEAIKAEEGMRQKPVLQYLLTQGKELSEAALTGFITGLIVGAIQQAFLKTYVVSPEDATQYANQFITKHKLPPYSTVTLGPSGEIVISWTDGEIELLSKLRPDLDPWLGGPGIFLPSKVEMILQPSISQFKATYHTFIGIRSRIYPLSNFGFQGLMYPVPPVVEALSSYGPMVGAANILEGNKP